MLPIEKILALELTTNQNERALFLVSLQNLNLYFNP